MPNRMVPDRTARAAAETLLARRAYSAQGLLDKLLEKGFGEPEAGRAVERLRELGYLDDEAYAQNLADSLARRGYGARRIKQTLKAKGVDGETADLVLEDDGGGPAQESTDARIDRWLVKLSKGRTLDKKECARLSAALFRRGFEGDEIRRGLRRFSDPDNDFEL